MSNADVRGRFVWHELITTSPEGATAFYSKLLPWKTQATPMPAYSLWTAGKGSVGGLMERPGEDETPVHWLVYIGTPDVDGTVAHAKDLGATVVKAPTDIPGEVGRYAVLEDPQGVRFAVFTPGSPGDTPPLPPGGEGTFTWHELATSEPDEAVDFYTELFGWERGPAHDLGGTTGAYHVLELDGRQIGAIHRGRPGTASRWLPYASVVDADEALDIIRGTGGKVLVGPAKVPGGTMLQLLDPQGAVFAVFEPETALAAAPVKPVKPPRARKAPVEADSEAPPPPRRPKPETRVVAAEQPKPAVASEPAEPALEEDEEEEVHEEEAVLEPAPKPVRSTRPRAPARKAPAKRAPARRTPAKKTAARAKTTRARPTAVAKKRPARKAPAKAASRTTRTARTPARPARAPARPATRAPARGRPAPGKRVAKKAVKGRRR